MRHRGFRPSTDDRLDEKMFNSARWRSEKNKNKAVFKLQFHGTQTLRKQIVKERKRGQDLLGEVVGLKEERVALKEECEKLEAFRKCTDDAKVRNNLLFEGEDLRAFVEELRQELDYVKELNANLWLQLQKTKESNSELILAEGLEEEINSKSEIDDDAKKTLEELLKGHSDGANPRVCLLATFSGSPSSFAADVGLGFRHVRILGFAFPGPRDLGLLFRDLPPSFSGFAAVVGLGFRRAPLVSPPT
ncbi:hypothetical protein U1Q18_025713 [Sarracenia purpurea var. burkii]